MKVSGFHPIGLHRKATTFNGVGTSTTRGKLKIPMAIGLQESDMVIPRYVHSHEILEKTHPLLVSQACQAKLGMTKRVRDGSITLDDYDAQSLEVARQVVIGLFMIRIDHVIRDDYTSNPLLDDFVIDFDDELGVYNVARDSDHSKSPDCVTHAMVNVRCRKLPRSVLQADTIVVNCGLANFERTSWSTQRRREFWDLSKNWTQGQTTTILFAVLKTTTLKCANGRSMWMIDCRKFDDPDSEKSLRKHIGRNPRTYVVHHGIQELPAQSSV